MCVCFGTEVRTGERAGGRVCCRSGARTMLPLTRLSPLTFIFPSFVFAVVASESCFSKERSLGDGGGGSGRQRC